MRVRLTKRQRIWHEAGETVEVSPAEANFLLSVKAAVIFAENRETPEASIGVTKETRDRRKKA